MKISPMGNNVLVKRAKSEEFTPGGLLIPSTSNEKSQNGEVLATGNGKMTSAGVLVAMTVQPGDMVLMEKGRGSDIKLDGETYILISEDHILAVLEK